MSTFNVHEWNRKRYLSEEVNEEYTGANFKPFKALIGTIANELIKMESEEALDTINRLMLYLKDAKATIEYKSSQE